MLPSIAPTPGMSSRLANALLSWSLSDIFDESLFLEDLDVIPDEYDDEFHDPAAYHETFLPHVVEELRACVANELSRPLEEFPLGNVSSVLLPSSTLVIDHLDGPPLPEYLNATIVLIINASMATLYRQGINRFPHFFGIVRKRLSPQEAQGSVSHSAAYLKTDLGQGDAQDEFLNGEKAKWTALFLSTPLIVHERIYQALKLRNSLSSVMMKSVLTGQDHRREVSGKEWKDVCAVLASLDSSRFPLNDSQRRVVESCLFNSTPLKTIQGPPGTGKSYRMHSRLNLLGKTMTLVAAIYGLVCLGKRVRVTAPTNQAICEISRRYVLAMSGADDEALAKTLLIGNENRLLLDDILDKIFIESRLAKLTTLVDTWERLHFELLEALSQFPSRSESIIEPAHGLRRVVDQLRCNLSLGDSLCQKFDRAYEKLLNFLEDFDSEDSLELNRLRELQTMLVRNFRSLKWPIARESMSSSLLLKEAEVIFSTVNTAGRQSLQSSEAFDVTIVDEANQIIEAETTILYSPYIENFILCGDFNQLQATVLSMRSKELKYSRSLFDRLVVRHGYPTMFLDIQYRMHPAINAWSNREFYCNQIQNSPHVMSDSYDKYWHKMIPPLSMLNTSDGEEETEEDGTSIFNELNILVVMGVLEKVAGSLGNRAPKTTVGVVTPYRAQAERILYRVNKTTFGNCIVSVRSVDGFQAQECDVCHFSSSFW